MRRHSLIFFAVLVISLIATLPVWGAVTGKISGKLTDSGTNQPLAGGNIIVEGTMMGAATQPEGDYFILNVPPGTYTLRARMIGYRQMVVENVTVRADFTTIIDFALEETVAAELEPVVVRAERPIIQPDVTATTRFVSAQELENMPTRGYQEAAYLQTGVISFALQPDFDITDSESQNQPFLNIRGGRYNEVAYYVDGFSQQDPLTGLSSTAINQSAIQDMTVLTGGFNAEYGKIMSGAVNVITREGGAQYEGAFEAVTDNLAGDWIGANKYDYNVYDLSLGGPGLIAPILTDKLNFYMSGERRWGSDRSPKIVTPDLAEDGILPGNSLGGWSWQSKLTYQATPNLKFNLGTLGSYDDWKEYRNTYLYDIAHSARYEDLNYSVTGGLTHVLSPSSFYTLSGSYFLTDRVRGDGVYYDDLAAYARPGGNPRYDQYLNLFYNIDDPTTDILTDRQGTVVSGDESHIWDDYLHRTSSYMGLKGDLTSQVNTEHQFKFGFDVERHTVRHYRHVLPVQVKLVDSTLVNNYDGSGHKGLYYHTALDSWTQDADYYGYTWTVTDSALVTPAHWRVVEIEDDEGNITYDSTYCFDYYKYSYGEQDVDSGRQSVKHPITASAYIQDKYEYEGVVVNAGIRYDYLNVDTKALRNDLAPLGDDNVRLDDEDLVDNEAQHVLSPRIGIGFPVSERTLFHANFGKFFQQPNLQDLYVSYDYLAYMIRTNPYYSPFGNPNLRPEKTTAYEVGVAHQIAPRARLDLVAYYKDVQDLVEVTNVNSVPNSFATYRNRDYGTIKGIDLGFQLARTNHIAANLAYSLSWATGTGSVSNTQTNIAWTGDSIPKMTAPLAFDQRHKVSFNLDMRFEDNEGPMLGDMKLLENAGVNLLLNVGSGQPYTPTFIWNEVTLAAVSVVPSGPINSKYGPWSYRVDLKADKGFRFGRTNVDFYVWVLNLFDKQNSSYVYQSTGSGETCGWLNTPEGEKWASDNGAAGVSLFRQAEMNPNNFGSPRMVRFGIRTGF